MQRNSNMLAWALAAILAVGCVLLYWRPWDAPARDASPSAANDGERAVECDPELDAQIARILQLHEAEQWPQAVTAWDELASNPQLCQRQRDEIARHRRNAQAMQTTASEGVAEYKPAQPPAPPEKPAPKADFLSYYPAGKTVESNAVLHLQGEGENKFWVWAGRAYFAYQYHLAARTAVTENDGEQAVFQIAFPTVAQLRATSREELALRGWEDASPILKFAWEEIDDQLSLSPHYFVLKKVGQLVNVVDPRLKRSLTFFNEAAKRAGFPLLERKDVEIAAQIERLAGTKLEVTYLRELGVTGIRVLEGERLTLDELAELAYNSSLLMDYFIFPHAQETQLGDEWDVNARDVAGVLNLNHDMTVDGNLRLRRGEARPETAPSGEATEESGTLVELSVVGGEVEASVETPDGPQSTTIRPQSGTVLYSQEDLMIRSAELELNMTEMQMSRDHLLFGTENVTNLRVQSNYVARLIEEGKQAEE